MPMSTRICEEKFRIPPLVHTMQRLSRCLHADAAWKERKNVALKKGARGQLGK